jgi:hypothetical protein
MSYPVYFTLCTLLVVAILAITIATDMLMP